VAVKWKTFTVVEDLIKAILIYPRRVRLVDPEDDVDHLEFESDDDSIFVISFEDFDKYRSQYCEGDIPMRVSGFIKAVKENKIEEWCEGINYGKPDFKESSC
jgi:hypothetical protein